MAKVKKLILFLPKEKAIEQSFHRRKSTVENMYQKIITWSFRQRQIKAGSGRQKSDTIQNEYL